MKNKICLIVTFFNPTESQIKYWTKIYNEFNLNGKIPVYFLLDGVKINFKNIINDNNIFYYENNKGKFKMIYDFLKNEKIDSSHFKVCDPDDYIDRKKIEKFQNEVSNEKINIKTLIKFEPWEVRKTWLAKFCLFFSINTFESLTNIFAKKRKIIIKSFPNSTTIYPTACIREDDKFSGKRIDFADDQLLGFISIANKAEIFISENQFYLYNSSQGVSGYKNIEKILDDALETFLEINNLTKNLDFGKNNIKISWPYFPYYEKKIEMFCNEFKITDFKKDDLYKKLEKLKEVNFSF